MCLKNKLQLDILPLQTFSQTWQACGYIVWYAYTSDVKLCDEGWHLFLIPFPLLIYLLKLIILSLPLNRPIITIKLYYSLSLSCLDTCTTFGHDFVLASLGHFETRTGRLPNCSRLVHAHLATSSRTVHAHLATSSRTVGAHLATSSRTVGAHLAHFPHWHDEFAQSDAVVPTWVFGYVI